MNRAKANYLNKLCAFFDNLPFDIAQKHLCVCLSGGADSVSLLRGLLLISSKYKFKISACHFNHMIRGGEADGDELFCINLCKSLDVELYRGCDDVIAYSKFNKQSIETAARECRYSFFQRIISGYNIDYCVTAHNMNDDAETLLLNLIRGSGSNGASAISAYNENFLRPLLKIKRNEIEAFLKEIEQNFVTDSTNLSDEYTRNYIRHIVVPSLEKINPSVVESLSRYIESSRQDRCYFEDLVKEHKDSDLRTVHKAIRSRVIIEAFTQHFGKRPNNVIIGELERAIFVNQRIIVPLFENNEAIVQDGRVTFCRSAENNIPEIDPIELTDSDNLIFGERINLSISANKLDIKENFNKLSTTVLLSFDNIKGTLYARNRRVGDKILIRGINRSLKKLFIEKKIPKEYRDIIPIIFDNEGIIYVPFVGISDRVHTKSRLNHKYITTVFNTIDKERWSNLYEK